MTIEDKLDTLQQRILAIPENEWSPAAPFHFYTFDARPYHCRMMRMSGETIISVERDGEDETLATYAGDAVASYYDRVDEFHRGPSRRAFEKRLPSYLDEFIKKLDE